MSTTLTCLRIDWANAHKINGSYATYIDYSSPSACLSSSGSSYLLVLEKPSYDFLVEQGQTQFGAAPVDNSIFLLVLAFGLAGMFFFGFSLGQRIFYK